MSDDFLYKEESYQIIGACFEVYIEKGSGFLEPVYQECLALELSDREIPFDEQVRLQMRYKSHMLKQGYQPDFLCHEKIILEIKAVKKLTDEHRAQIINYLKATRMKLGLLVNFGHHPQLEYERFINEK